MRRGVILLSLVVAISLFGCQHVPNPVSASSVVSIDSILVVEVWVSDKCPENGKDITVRATVTNKGTKTQVLDSKDQPVLDLIVTTGGTGGVKTRWSDGKALTPDLTHLELQPGQSKTIEIDRRVTNLNNRFSVEAALFDPARFYSPVMPYVLIAPQYGCNIIDLP